MTDTPATPQLLPYATALTMPRPPRLAAAVWLAIIGLFLIGIGGCFMIGIMVTVHRTSLFSGAIATGSMSYAEVMFLVVMYVIAFGCFGGAFAMLLRSIRSLFKLMEG